MRVKLITLAAALLPFVAPLVLPGHASSTDLSSPAGLWQALDDDTKQPSGWFLITDHGGVYDGVIAKMFFKPGENSNPTCDQCKDDRHDHPWLGLEIIRGMKPEGETKFGDGTILDPRDGKIYHAIMKVSPDGGTLTVRGYIGIELLGQNQYWTRLPDSAYSQLDPSISPNTAATANPAAKHPIAPPPAHKPPGPTTPPAGLRP
jgi:uncharacterized protein (DUF2147 family)